jgi:hypothetical protein
MSHERLDFGYVAVFLVIFDVNSVPARVKSKIAFLVKKFIADCCVSQQQSFASLRPKTLLRVLGFGLLQAPDIGHYSHPGAPIPS